MSDEPRDKRLAEYNELLEELLEGLVGMEELQQGGDGEEDEELRALLADARAKLADLAQSLNAEETIAETPGLVKVLLPSAQVTASAKDDSKAEAPVMVFPPSDTPRLCAPYEVRYDDRHWYPCVITAVVPPADAVDRLTYKAWILGYNVEETVPSEALRSWGPSQEDARKDAMRSGAACHAIRPSTCRFEPATVERLTLEGTVIVSFTGAKDKEGKDAEEAETETTELPLSHVHVGAKFYPVLRKRPQLTEEERKARRQANARQKRERAAEEKQRKADKVAQDASDWQGLMGDMMGGGGDRRRRRL